MEFNDENRSILIKALAQVTNFDTPIGRQSATINAGIYNLLTIDINWSGPSKEVATAIVNHLISQDRFEAILNLIEYLLKIYGVHGNTHKDLIKLRREILADPNIMEAILPTNISAANTSPSDLILDAFTAQQYDVSFLLRGSKRVPLVLSIRTPDKSGTGVYITPQWVLTCAHLFGFSRIPEDVAQENISTIEDHIFQSAFLLNYHRDASPSEIREIHPQQGISPIIDLKSDIVLIPFNKTLFPMNVDPPSTRMTNISADESLQMIHHAEGGVKQVLFNAIAREHQPEVLRYIAPTYAGSSGSPIWDTNWNLVAIHRATEYKEKFGTRIYFESRAIPISTIQQHIPLNT